MVTNAYLRLCRKRRPRRDPPSGHAASRNLPDSDADTDADASLSPTPATLVDDKKDASLDEYDTPLHKRKRAASPPNGSGSSSNAKRPRGTHQAYGSMGAGVFAFANGLDAMIDYKLRPMEGGIQGLVDKYNQLEVSQAEESSLRNAQQEQMVETLGQVQEDVARTPQTFQRCSERWQITRRHIPWISQAYVKQYPNTRTSRRMILLPLRALWRIFQDSIDGKRRI
jgi:hypothetical protein